MDSGFDATGGFYLIDHERRRAAYAYPSSQRAATARRDRSKATKAMAVMMVHDEWVPERIRLDHYAAVCRAAGIEPI